MNISFYIAKRYLVSKSGTSAINIITLIAMFGVVVCSLALFVILSGFSGLRTFSYSLLDTSDPDIKITSVKGKSFIFNPDIEQVLLDDVAVKAYSRIVEERAFLQHNNKSYIAKIKGVDQNYSQVVGIKKALDTGTWLDPTFPNTAVIGIGISYKLSLGVLNFGEGLRITIPKAGKGFVNPNKAFNVANVQVVGIYKGLEDFQNKYVFTAISLAQELLQFKHNEVSAVEIKISNLAKADVVRNRLQKQIGDNYKVQTKQQLNIALYKVLNSENLISYLIGTLITIIALFNIFGNIIMIIIEKKKNLKTLFNLGASIQNIKHIFVLQGFLLTLAGMAIGVTLGVLLVLIQKQYALFYIIPDVPYPIEFRWMNVLIVVTTISALGYVVAKIAGSRITKKFIES